jgi:hypothetical protein
VAQPFLSVTGAANVSRYDCGVAFRSSDVKRAIRELLRTEGLEIEPAALLRRLDEGLFRVPFDRLTPRESD